MRRTKMKKTLLALLASAPAAGWTHEGHGLPGASHWHATDTLGWLLAGVVALALVWWGRRK